MTASLVVAQLLFLESEDPNKDINLYINSPGGSVTAGMAIYDTMNYIKCDVCTTCIGMAASMGAFLLSSGAKGKRFALPNAEVMIHQRPVSPGTGDRDQDRCRADLKDKREAQQDPGCKHRTAARRDCPRHRERQLHDSRGSCRIRSDRPRDLRPLGPDGAKAENSAGAQRDIKEFRIEVRTCQ